MLNTNRKSTVLRCLQGLLWFELCVCLCGEDPRSGSASVLFLTTICKQWTLNS